MAVKLLMPALSPTMTEGRLSKWCKNEGDKIKIGEVLAEIETDKATMEYESIDEGILAKIIIAGNTDNVAVNSLIGVILEEGESEKDLEQIILQSGRLSSPSVTQPSKENETYPTKELAQPEVMPSNSLTFASPLARRIASQNNLELQNIVGTGPKNRIIKDDVLSFLEKSQNPNIDKEDRPAIRSKSSRNTSEYEKITNNNMRKIIAKRLSESKREIPHFYLEVECEMDKLLSFREELNQFFKKTGKNSKISVNDFIIKAVSYSLKNVPAVNSSWGEDFIKQYNNVDVAVAVAIDNGLVTPIIQNSDQKSILEISETMKELASRAKTFSLRPEEFQGGSFTISNLGMLGIDNFQAIINPPQSAILAVGATVEKPVAKNGNIVIAYIMKVTLSCDHRVIDGAVAAKFLGEFKNFIENPSIMLAI